MIIFVNSKNEIKDVNFTSDETLTPVEVTDGTFDSWSTARILCYKVEVADGHVMMLTPYVDSRIVEQLDKSGIVIDQNTSDITDAQVAIVEGFEVATTNTNDITDIQLGMAGMYEYTDTEITSIEVAMAEMYEMILANIETIIASYMEGQING